MHIPVLQKEVLQYLNPEPNQNFIDATISSGGHALAILEKNGPQGRILGIDQDAEILKNTKYKIQNTKYKNRAILICDNFSNLKEIVEKEKFQSVSGILFDLGMSSWHLEESGRGFSFLKNEPLDMRYNSAGHLTAEKILNYWSKFEIEKILREYGEEKFAKKIAEGISSARKIKPIKNTFQLIKIIEQIVSAGYRNQRIHFATRTFQALRISINDELNNLKKVLSQALDILEPGGRLAVISFHSLEDRIVKNFFKKYIGCTYGNLKILTKKPITPTNKEVKINPRARSAKLRIIKKIYLKI